MQFQKHQPSVIAAREHLLNVHNVSHSLDHFLYFSGAEKRDEVLHRLSGADRGDSRRLLAHDMGAAE